MQDPKNHQKLAIWAPSRNFVGLYLRNWGTYRQSEKNLLSSNISFTRLHNMVNFGPLTVDIDWRVWGTPSYFNGHRVLAALLHDTLLVGVSQTLRRWTEGATYIPQGDHRVGHWPTFLVITYSLQEARVNLKGHHVSKSARRYCLHWWHLSVKMNSY